MKTAPPGPGGVTIINSIALTHPGRLQTALKAAAEKERKKDAVIFFAMYEDRSDVIYAKKDKPWGVIKQEVCRQLEVGFDAAQVDLLRLHPRHHGSKGCATTARQLPIDDETLVGEIASELKINGALIKLEINGERPRQGAG